MMQANPAQAIERHSEDSPFDQLRSELLNEVQALTSQQWTDYNLHDPGVTMLEQLAYALTDINYRASYPITTLLADWRDDIALNTHGLFAPGDALVCRPVCQHDLQMALLDELPALAYVRAEYLTEFPGLIDLWITPKNARIDCQALQEEVNAAYHRHRNLNEHLRRINTINSAQAELRGCIELHRDVVAERVLAAVFFTVQQSLLGIIRPVNYQTLNQAIVGAPYDGPRMRHHFLNRADLQCAEKPRSISALIEQLMQLSGVQAVQELGIKEIGEHGEVLHQHFLLPACELALYLTPPLQKRALSGLDIRQHGSRVVLDIHRLRHEYQALVSHTDSRCQQSSMPSQQNVIAAVYHDLADYSSVQAQFPSNYGINAFGVPAHSDNERKAQARQLQGYLLLYDHLLHDHLQLLDHLKQLFSLDTETQQLIPATPVQDASVYDLQGLYYRDIPPDLFAHEPAGKPLTELKQDVFELLLAMNGRDQIAYAHERFPLYLTGNERRGQQLGDRQTALARVHQWSEHRGGGPNLLRRSERSLCALEQRIRLQLGAPLQHTSLLPSTFSAIKNAPVTDRAMFSSVKAQLTGMAFYALNSPLEAAIDNARPVAPADVDITEALLAVTIYANQASERLSRIWAAWQAYGADLSRYRIARLTVDNHVEILLNLAADDAPEQWHYLASFSHEAAAIHFANRLRVVALHEAKRRRGVHLVEHLPLLPQRLLTLPDTQGLKALAQRLPFYFQQLTWVLPKDTEANRQPHFAEFVHSQIWQECPAHLYSHVLWLDTAAMQQFEARYFQWLRLSPAHAKALDKAAAALRDFLLPYLPAELTKGG